MSAALNRAREIGREHGGNAAAWWEQDAIGGRSSGDPAPAARKVLAGIEDGDPEILDSLPAPDLSGESADGYLPSQLEFECLNHQYGILLTWIYGPQPDTDELCDAYERAFTEAAWDKVSPYCRNVLND